MCEREKMREREREMCVCVLCVPRVWYILLCILVYVPWEKKKINTHTRTHTHTHTLSLMWTWTYVLNNEVLEKLKYHIYFLSSSHPLLVCLEHLFFEKIVWKKKSLKQKKVWNKKKVWNNAFVSLEKSILLPSCGVKKFQFISHNLFEKHSNSNWNWVLLICRFNVCCSVSHNLLSFSAF